MKIKPVLGENGKFLKKVFDVLTSLSICISGSHSFNPRLTSHETLIPNNNFFWMRKGSYSWVFALLVLDLILLIFVGPSCIRCFIIMHLCIMHLFICIAFFLFCFDLTFMSLFCLYKNPKPHKKWKIQKKFIVYVWALFTCEFGLIRSY